MATEDLLKPFFEQVFTPRALTSFRGAKTIQVLQFERPDAAPRSFTLTPYPFMTVYDLKIMIYQTLGKSVQADPSFQSLLIPIPIGVADPTTLAEEYLPLDFVWTRAGSSSKEDILPLINPFQRASGPSTDSEFVTESGRKVNGYASRHRATLEEICGELFEDQPWILHLFLYKDVYPLTNPALRVSEREWYGRIDPYYPDLEQQQDPTTLPEAKRIQLAKYNTYVEKSVSLLNVLNTLLEEGRVADLREIKIIGIKFMRLIWPAPEAETPELEPLFYQLPVTDERPFTRILANTNSPVSKVLMKGTTNEPDISNPRLLSQWASEENPFPNKDFLFAKIVIRETIGAQAALYGTLRLFENRSADFLLIPPERIRVLTPNIDLLGIGALMTKALEGTPVANRVPDLAEASIVCGIPLPLRAKPLSPAALRKRLPAFASLFQEIEPLAGEKPLLKLRYKGVSNFATEDRVYAYLTQLATRRVLRGEVPLAQLQVAVMEEFGLSETEATKLAGEWWASRGEVILAMPEYEHYILVYNPGIDVAIYGAQGYYTVHLDRVDSKENFDRIMTAISLLVSASETQLRVAPQDVASLAEAASAVVVRSGSAPQIEGRVDEAPAGAAPLEEDGAEAFGDAEDMGGIWGNLMLGRPAANGDEEEEAFPGEGEALNLNDQLNANARRNVNRGAAVAAVAEDAKEDEEAVAAVLAPAGANRPLAAPAVVAEAKEEEADDEEEEGPGKKKSYVGWVKTKLQEADNRLFVYKTDIPGRKIKTYVKQCQATESRQPYVLNEAQYRNMRAIYNEDENRDEIAFREYPLSPDEPIPEGRDETFTVLKYGTDPVRQNFYLCCRFFCTKDYILVREKDFYSTKDRDGKSKPGESSPGKKDNGSCPFCHRLEIKNLKDPKPNESVIQRRLKKKDNKRHLYIGFLKGETEHPERLFYLPCCFTEDNTVRRSDRQFEHIRQAEAPPVEELPEDEEEIVTLSSPVVSYQLAIARAHKKYIVGPEKFPLKLSEVDGPQIGLLPSVLDAYFAQDPKDYVAREFNKMELLATSKAFLRIGVENRSSYLNDSFFSAIAPFLDYRNNATAVKKRLLEYIRPRIFAYLNFGNLVLEFYDPGDKSPTEKELRLWAKGELGVDLHETKNKQAVERLYKSYMRFEAFVKSTDTLKQYRQFAQVLARPGLTERYRGIVFIVLDINEKNEVQVRCPPFGFNADQYLGADIGFLLHHHTGIWEPIFYAENKAAGGGFGPRHDAEFKFQRADEARWPDIVRKRVREFMKQCAGPGRGAYTSFSEINPRVIAPLSMAVEMIGPQPEGVIRDAYNHIAALTYYAVPGKPGLVAVPVIDDEFAIQRDLPYSLNLHLDWDDLQPAHMEDIVDFYRRHIENSFALFPGYKLSRRVRSRGTDQYEAVKLKNGLYIPSRPPRSEAVLRGFDEIDYVDEMEWSMNRRILFQDTKVTEDPEFKASEEDLNEIFQHLRLTFSNWFGSASVDPDFRRSIRKIIEDKRIPLFEKRKRLDILLGSTILGWMDTDIPVTEVPGTFLREDCRLRAEATCTGRCSWRVGREEEVGKCLLHSPKDVSLGGRKVNGIELLKNRLIEELLRYPEQRRELLTKQVPTLTTMKEAIRVGDQYILPDSSIAWYDLTRLDWMSKGKEKKMYFEELSANSAINTKPVPEGTVTEPLSEDLKALFGADDPKLAGLSLIKADVSPGTPPLTPYLILLGTSAGELGMDEDAGMLTRDGLVELVKKARIPILQIHLGGDPQTLAIGPRVGQRTMVPYILVITPAGPRILSSNPKIYQPVQPDAMPAGLFDIYDNRDAV